MPNPSDLATNLGRYHILPNYKNDNVVCDFRDPFGSFGADADSTTVTAWGISRKAKLPCVVILQLDVNQHYIIPYATFQPFESDPKLRVMQAVAYDLDRAYDWMFRQGCLGSIVYRDDSGLVFDGRWLYFNEQIFPAILAFNGTGIPPPGGWYTRIRTKRLG